MAGLGNFMKEISYQALLLILSLIFIPYPVIASNTCRSTMGSPGVQICSGVAEYTPSCKDCHIEVWNCFGSCAGESSLRCSDGSQMQCHAQSSSCCMRCPTRNKAIYTCNLHSCTCRIYAVTNAVDPQDESFIESLLNTGQEKLGDFFVNNQDRLRNFLNKILESDASGNIKEQISDLLDVMNRDTQSINPKFTRDIIIRALCEGVLTYLGCEAAYTGVGFLLAGPAGMVVTFEGSQPQCLAVAAAELGNVAIGSTLGEDKSTYFRQRDKSENDRWTQGGTERKINPSKAESKIWKELENYKIDIKTNGLSGKDKEYYKWDKLHNDIEVYDREGKHLGSKNPTTGKMYKPANPEYDIGREL